MKTTTVWAPMYAAAPESFGDFLKTDSGHLPLASSFYRRSIIDVAGRLDATLRSAFTFDLNCRLMSVGYAPTITRNVFASTRVYRDPADEIETLRHGMELITVARRYGEQLPMRQRYALWRHCDLREREYALAQAEVSRTPLARFPLGRSDAQALVVGRRKSAPCVASRSGGRRNARRATSRGVRQSAHSFVIRHWP